MNLQTFKAPTMAAALSQVKTAMGTDAVILHTRSYTTRQWLGLRRREIVEITAGKDVNIVKRPVKKPVVAKAPLGYTPASLAKPQAMKSLADNSQQLLATPAANSAIMLNISQEMNQLKSMVAEIVRGQNCAKAPHVPQDLFDFYQQLIENQVAEQLAHEVVSTLQKNLRPEHLQQPNFVREQLEKMIPTTGPIFRRKANGPHVVALIGPTGVGKTTTLAKLAANLKLREKHRVGLITLDTYRIAAVDQLRKYADIIGSPLKVVNGTDDLREAVASMADCEFILIDTAGRSPKDTMKLNELRGLLDSVNPDEVHLVLSTTSSASSIELAIERFAEVRLDKIIFTKLDEASHVGVVLNVVRKVNKSLSYITTGQNVPNDIEECQGKRLAQLILGQKL
jgi:flagellar biosynthesis protein FlhF